MHKTIAIFALTFILAQSTAFAQEISGGFRAGLNFNQFDGPAETDANGQALDRFENITGFHISASFVMAFTDLMGVKADFMYTQKGATYRYDGPSYFNLYRTDGAPGPRLLGTRVSVVDMVNSYLDLPVQAYVKLGPVELSAGASIGFLLASVGDGAIRFTPDNTTVDPFTVTLDYNFLKGDDRGADAIKESEVRNVLFNAVNLPTIIDAYYESAPNDEKRFNRIDLGLVGEISFFLNKGLYLSGRLNYGLSDVTRTEQDLAARQVDNTGKFITREDKDRNVSIQTSIGFRF